MVSTNATLLPDCASIVLSGGRPAREPRTSHARVTMTSRMLRATRGLGWAATMLVAVTACATRRPETAIPPVPVAAGVVWRVEPYDLLKTRVYRQPELSAEVSVTANGTAFFPGVGKMTVAGLTSDSLESLLNARYATLIREPAVQVTLQRELTVYGQVRSPGVYLVDPGSTLLNLTARGGGQAGSDAPIITLETSTGQKFSMPREARLGSIDLHRQDAIYLAEPSMFARNSAALSSTTLIITSLSAAIGLISILTR